MRTILTLTGVLILSFSSYGQLNESPPNRSFHVEIGTGLVTSDGRFGGSYSIEPQFTFANNVSLGFEFNHKNLGMGDKNIPHKVNSFSPSIQIKGKSSEISPFIGGRIGYYRVYDIADTEPSSIDSIGAALNVGIYAWVVKLGMEVSFYKPYGGSEFVYLKIRI